MKKIFINLIKKYQKELSPYLSDHGVACLFNPSCSNYALICLEKHNVIIALILITYRLLSCNPINAYLKERKLKTNI